MDQNVNVNINANVTGNAKNAMDALTGSTIAATKSVQQLNAEYARENDLIQKQAIANVNNLVQQKKVLQEMRRQLIGSGQTLNEAGQLVPEKRSVKPPQGLFSHLGREAGAAGQMGMNRLGLGGLGAAGSAVAGAAIGVAAGVMLLKLFAHVMAKATELIDINASYHINETHRRQALEESMDFTGLSKARRMLAESIIGGQRRTQDQISMIATRERVGFLESSFGPFMSARSRAEGAQATYQATLNNPYGSMPSIDRSGVGGDRQQREAEMRMEAQDELVRSRREEEAASSLVPDSDERLRIAQRRLEQHRSDKQGWVDQAAELEKKQDKYNKTEGDQSVKYDWFDRNVYGPFITPLKGEKQSGTPKNDAMNAVYATGIPHARTEEAKAELEIQKDIQNVTKLTADNEEKRSNAANKNLQLKQSEIGVLKTELAISKQREQLGSQGATRLGMMSKGARMSGVAAVRFLKEYGPEAATPDIWAASSSVAPLWTQKQGEKHGLGVSERQDLIGILGKEADDVKFDPNVERGKQGGKGGLIDAVRGAMGDADTDIAKNMAGILGSSYERFLKAFSDELKNVELRIMTAVRTMFNERKPGQ